MDSILAKSGLRALTSRVYYYYLHRTGDAFSITKDLMERLCTQDVAQGRLCQKTCGMMGVLNVGHGNGGVTHAIVNDSIHRNGDRVSREHLGIDIILLMLVLKQ